MQMGQKQYHEAESVSQARGLQGSQGGSRQGGEGLITGGGWTGCPVYSQGPEPGSLHTPQDPDRLSNVGKAPDRAPIAVPRQRHWREEAGSGSPAVFGQSCPAVLWLVLG